MYNHIMKKLSLPFIGFLQASGLTVYVILVSLFFNLFPNSFDKGVIAFYAPVIMLLLFIMSAVISALLVLGKAGVLFWEKKYKESFTLLGYTVLWILFYFGLFVLLTLKI